MILEDIKCKPFAFISVALAKDLSRILPNLFFILAMPLNLYVWYKKLREILEKSYAICMTDLVEITKRKKIHIKMSLATCLRTCRDMRSVKSIFENLSLSTFLIVSSSWLISCFVSSGLSDAMSNLLLIWKNFNGNFSYFGLLNLKVKKTKIK